MDNKKMVFDDSKLAQALREEILRSSQEEVIPSREKIEPANFEYISTTAQEPYVSPIMTMNEDEILDFVERFEVSELATLSVAELNRIGEVLGVPPEILVEGEF